MHCCIRSAIACAEIEWSIDMRLLIMAGIRHTKIINPCMRQRGSNERKPSQLPLFRMTITGTDIASRTTSSSWKGASPISPPSIAEHAWNTETFSPSRRGGCVSAPPRSSGSACICDSSSLICIENGEGFYRLRACSTVSSTFPALGALNCLRLFGGGVKAGVSSVTSCAGALDSVPMVQCSDCRNPVSAHPPF